VLRGSKVSKVIQEHKELKVIQEQQEPREHKVFKVL
jgi:hypothetical protein